MRILIAVLALGGIIDSGLALRVHFADPNAAPACAVDEHWDCGAVNTSKYAVFPPTSLDEDPAAHKIHIPVAAIGIAGYTLMLLLALSGRWWALLQVSEIGFAAAAFLTYLEAYVIRKWCIYCLWSQGIVTAIVLATIVALVLRHRAGQRLRVPAPAAERTV
jgi:uncharacterized membrane protein